MRSQCHRWPASLMRATAAAALEGCALFRWTRSAQSRLRRAQPLACVCDRPNPPATDLTSPMDGRPPARHHISPHSGGPPFRHYTSQGAGGRWLFSKAYFFWKRAPNTTQAQPAPLVLCSQLPSSSPLIRDWELKLQAYRKINPMVFIVDTPQAARQARHGRQDFGHPPQELKATPHPLNVPSGHHNVLAPAPSQLSNRATMLQAVEGLNLTDALGAHSGGRLAFAPRCADSACGPFRYAGTTVAVPRQILVEGGHAQIAAAMQESGLQFPLCALLPHPILVLAPLPAWSIFL